MKVPNPCHGAPRPKVTIPVDHYGIRLDFTPSTAQLIRYCEYHRYKMVMKWDEETSQHRPTFDEGAIEKLLLKYPKDPLFPLIKKFRTLQKCVGTYVDGLTLAPSELGNEYGRVIGELLHVPKSGRLCVAKGTLIEVLRDSAKFPLGIPIEDVQEGMFAYSFDADKRLCLRKVKHSWKTGIRKVVRVHWKADSQKFSGYTDMTPDHRVRLVTGAYQEAQLLKEGDRILSLSRGITLGYSRLWATGHEAIEKEHRFVYRELINKNVAEHVHHLNGNRLDNRPENLEGLTAVQHTSLHAKAYFSDPKVREQQSEMLRKRWHTEDGIPRRNTSGKRPVWLGITREWLENALYEVGGDTAELRRRTGIEHHILKKYLDKLKVSVTRIKAECASTKNHRVTWVEELVEPVDVYDLEIEDTNNFIAGGLCVHNSMKGAPHQLQPRTSDPENPFYQVREMYVAGPDSRITELDFGGIEGVLTMYLSGVNVVNGVAYAKPNADDARHGLRLTGIDIHGFVSSHAIGQPADLKWSDADLKDYFALFRKENRLWKLPTGMTLYEDIRDANKTGLYASLYGGGPSVLMQSQPKLFPDEAAGQRVQDLIFGLFPSIPNWWWEVAQEADTLGYITTPDGYRQWFSDVIDHRYSKKKQKWIPTLGKLAKEAIAGKPQHLGMLFTGAGIGRFWAQYPEYRQYLRLTIHDSILTLQVDARSVEVYVALKQCMETPMEVLPLPVEWGMGSNLVIKAEGKWTSPGGNWREMKKISLAS